MMAVVVDTMVRVCSSDSSEVWRKESKWGYMDCCDVVSATREAAGFERTFALCMHD